MVTCKQWLSYCEAIYVYFSVMMSKYNSKMPLVFSQAGCKHYYGQWGGGGWDTAVPPSSSPSLHPHSHLQRREEQLVLLLGRSCSSRTKPSSLKSWFKAAGLSLHHTPRALPTGPACNLSHASWDRLLSCLVLLFNSCTIFPLLLCDFSPPK